MVPCSGQCGGQLRSTDTGNVVLRKGSWSRKGLERMSWMQNAANQEGEGCQGGYW